MIAGAPPAGPVFSNTTPLIALAGIGRLDLLPALFGRDMAELLGLLVVGTLGVLLKAKALGLIPSFTSATQQMRQNGIYFHERLLAQLQERAGEGR